MVTPKTGVFKLTNGVITAYGKCESNTTWHHHPYEFSKINEVMQMPNLIEVQKNSYQWFLDVGLKEVFRDIGEITDYTGNLVLEFVDYTMDEEPKYSVKECKERDATYAAPIRVKARLFNKETGKSKKVTFTWVTSR